MSWPTFPRLWPKSKYRWINRLHRWLNTQLDMIEHRASERAYKELQCP